MTSPNWQDIKYPEWVRGDVHLEAAYREGYLSGHNDMVEKINPTDARFGRCLICNAKLNDSLKIREVWKKGDCCKVFIGFRCETCPEGKRIK